MPFEKRDASRISRSFWNNPAALVQKRRRRHARWATIYNRPGRVRCLSVAMVLRQTNPLLLWFWCWPNRTDAPRAWRRPYHEQPGCRVRLRLARSRLPWQRLLLELSRSSDSYRGLLRRFLLIMFAMLLVHRQKSFGMLNRRPNDHVTAVRARNRAADQNNLFGFAHLHDLEILHCDAFITHVTGHSHVFPNSPRSRTVADCANAPVRFRTVRRALSMKVVLLHHALKSFSFRSADHVDIVTRLKLRDA